VLVQLIGTAPRSMSLWSRIYPIAPMFVKIKGASPGHSGHDGPEEVRPLGSRALMLDDPRLNAQTASARARGRRPRSPSVTAEAIEKIRELIVTGRWGPGDRLPRESELAAQLGLSRNSLREAVRALSQLRVLEVRQGDGTYVSSLEPDLLLESTGFVSHLLLGDTALELYEVRRILEAAAAVLAAARIDEQGKQELGSNLERMRKAEVVEDLVEADVAFHAVIARAAGNSVLTSLLASLSTRTMRVRLWHGRATADNALDETREEHHRMYEAIVERDPELARATSTAHIASGERWLRAQLADKDSIAR
jgi:GntR family transcriptional regulator, transcriptional repressor for pyruvate dehydrogenase complex